MNPAAKVTNTRAIADFSAAVATFASISSSALSSVGQEIQRLSDWLEEQRQFWVRALRKVEEDFIHARQELARRKMMRIGDRPVATSDQELALRKAKVRFEYVQEKLAKTKEWQRVLPQLVLDNLAPVKVLQNNLDADLPKMRSFLDQKLNEIEQYAREQL